MKRILFLSVIAALLYGCNSANHEGQGSATDTISVDSVANIVTAESEPAEPQLVEPDSVTEPEKPFTTPDLKWKQLQGHVKQLKVIWEYGEEIFKFDRQGNFISYHNSSDMLYKIKRNKNGQIAEWNLWEDETDFYNYGEYTYNGDGYVYKMLSAAEADEDEYVYVLNEQGWPVSASWKCEDGEMGDDEVYHHKGTVTYSYSNIDDKGNWRKCVVKCKHPYFHNYTETRKITYWE